jgi:hypothetical protein
MAKNVGFIIRKSVMMDGLEEADHVLGCSWRVDKAKEFGYWACRIANCMELMILRWWGVIVLLCTWV